MSKVPSIQVEGLEELNAMLKDIAPRQVNNILRNAVFAIATDVRDALKRNVKKDTGLLAQDIRAVRRRGKPNYHVAEVHGGGTRRYMLMLEFGTKFTRAQPFIVPTTEQMRSSLPALYKERFGQKLEQALAKEAKAQRTR